jgi:hypothetical protein
MRSGTRPSGPSAFPVLSRHNRPANGFNIRAVLAGQRHARGGEPIFLKHAHDGAFGAIAFLSGSASHHSTSFNAAIAASRVMYPLRRVAMISITTARASSRFCWSI